LSERKFYLCEKFRDMAEKIINDRIALFSVIDSFGEEGATFQKIQYAYERMVDKKINQRQFHRCRGDIEKMFGVQICCKKAGADSKYYVDKVGTSPLKDDRLRMSCMNAYLLNNIVSDDRFTKDRIYIAESYNNEQARIIANAMAQKRNIIVVRKKHEYSTYLNEEGKPYLKAKFTDDQFEFIPYALSYTACWYVFGKKPGNDELLVFSVQNFVSFTLLGNFDDYPEEFNLKKILDNFDEYLPLKDSLPGGFVGNGFVSSSAKDDRLSFWQSYKTANFNTI